MSNLSFILKKSKMIVSSSVVLLAISISMLPKSLFAASGDESFGEAPLQQFCTTKEYDNVQAWRNYADNVLVGEVTEVRPRFDSSSGWSNQCWARLIVQKNVKGKTQNEVWARIFYDPYGRTKNGSPISYKSVAACPVKIHETYLVFAVSNSRSDAKSSPFPYLLMASGSSRDHCTPIIPISEAKKELEELETH